MKFGLFVELPNTVEGLVHISVMKDDYYEYSEKHMAQSDETLIEFSKWGSLS